MTTTSTITAVKARQIFDSRGTPTVEVEVFINDDCFRAAVPSGASTGAHEAHELRDQNPKEYLGKGVSKAVENVNKVLGPQLIKAKLDPRDQKAVDAFLNSLDGTPSKSKLGANAILGVSMAVCRAGAHLAGRPLYSHIHALRADLTSSTAAARPMTLPCPAFNVINGGAHASNPIVFQEFMILPTGAKSFAEAMKMGSEVYGQLKKILAGKYGQEVQVGDEGGFAPDLPSPAAVLQVVQEAVQAAGHEGKIKFAMDIAASEFYDEKTGKYDLDKKRKSVPMDQHRLVSGAELIEEYTKLKAQFPQLVSIEDPCAEDDWPSWVRATAALSLQIVGDDLTVTNPTRIREAQQKKACNALLLKINQIGTITESIEAAKLAQDQGWGLMVSHRSGETEDTFIADLAVGLDAKQIKSGAPCRSERLAKYNQLLRIEEETRGTVTYTPPPAFL